MNLTDQREEMVDVGMDASRFSILLIEKDKSLVKLLQEFLRAYSCKVDWRTDLTQIRQAAMQRRYQLVLLDIALDKGAGLHLIPWLQYLQPNANFVTMTDRNPKEIEQQVRAHRVFYHLIKPFSHMEFAHLIKEISTQNSQLHKNRTN